MFLCGKLDSSGIHLEDWMSVIKPINAKEIFQILSSGPMILLMITLKVRMIIENI